MAEFLLTLQLQVRMTKTMRSSIPPTKHCCLHDRLIVTIITIVAIVFYDDDD